MQIDQFRSYCRPEINPVLTAFCTQLTGIEQVCWSTPCFPPRSETLNLRVCVASGEHCACLSRRSSQCGNMAERPTFSERDQPSSIGIRHGRVGEIAWVTFAMHRTFPRSPWDFAEFLQSQCRFNGIPYPPWAKQWIDIRKAFAGFYAVRRSGKKQRGYSVPLVLFMLQVSARCCKVWASHSMVNLIRVSMIPSISHASPWS
jgi:inhibitor of KinA sporulation pathway (predicted exonuclease)